MDRPPIKLLACEGARDLATAVATHLGTSLTPSNDTWFACSEGKHVIDENIRGADVYIFQRSALGLGANDEHSPYERFVMLLHAVDAARHADAERVTVVMPYLLGSRQDKRKGRTREGVSTGLFARMLREAGASMVISVEPHNEAISGAYAPALCVFEPVFVAHALGDWMQQRGLAGELFASTDVGGLQLARRFAKHLHRGIVALSKERDYSQPNTVAHTTVIGEVRDRTVTIVDDIVDTAGSAVAAAEALWESGARDIVIAGIHPLHSAPAWDRLDDLAERARKRGFKFAVVGTTSVVHVGAPDWYQSFPLEAVLAEVVHSVNARGSVRGVTEG